VALTQDRLLSSVRFNRIVGRLAAVLDVERPLNFLARVPLTPAFDDELTGRFTGRVLAADIVADDQEALVNESLSLDVVTHAAPNVKLGERLGQKLLTRLKQWEQGLYRNVQGENALADWENQLADKLVLGVRQRLNAMAAAMMIDSFSYDRFGVKLSGATWGMPPDLKTTVLIAWTNPTTATPISDILGVDAYTRVKYGIVYDVVTMSTADFQLMIATTEFANKATLNVGGAAAFLLTPAALKTASIPDMLNLAGRILNKDIVLDDTTFNERSAAGTLSQSRALPLGKVLLSRKEDEGNGRAYDMANGMVTETMVADMAGASSMVGGGLPADAFGPIGYFTARPDLNPPDVVCWAVARAFPRKFVPESTAVLTVR
jgi:hypothetical protein